MWILLFFFFFKQKTAYEMRISDWSSDVCSSDLLVTFQHECAARQNDARARGRSLDEFHHATCTAARLYSDPVRAVLLIESQQRRSVRIEMDGSLWHGRHRRCDIGKHGRSEEHTSELQSLMRISYAVYYVKKHNT